MAIPVVETFEFQGNDAGSPDTDITLSKPSGLAVGDLCLVFVCTDHDDGPAWVAKTGWTLEVNEGTSDSDTCAGIYWRIADGTEGATETFVSTETDDLCGWWIRISGVDQLDPINNKSTQESTGSQGDYDILGHSTTLDDCLAIWFMNFDGADGDPWVVTGTGWTDFEYGETPGGDNTDVSGGWGQKEMASAGATGTVNVDPDATDGMTGGQISINSPPPITTLMNAAGIVGAAQNMTLVPGAATIVINATGITATAQSLGVVTGAFTIPMNPAALNAVAQNLTLVPGAVTISMNAGALNITAENINIFNGILTQLLTAGLTVTAEALDVVPGTATISMQAANINLTGETLQIVPGAVTIQANAATLNAIAQQLQVVPGNVNIAMQDAQIIGTAETLQVVSGAVIVTMQTAQIVSAGEQLQVIPGPVTITMQDAQLTFTAETLTVSSFGKILIKGINKVTGEPIVIEGVIKDR